MPRNPYDRPQEYTFLIEMQGQELPVNYNDEALESFEKKAADAMDREIRHISDIRYGKDHYLTRSNRLGVLAPLLYNAITDQDGDKIMLCVLWLATKFPEIRGIEMDEGLIQYIQEDQDEEPFDAFARPKYLN